MTVRSSTGTGKLKAQCVSSGKTIPVVLKATRISAALLGIAALALAVGAVPADAGKKRKPEKVQAEPVVNVDTKEPMIVVVSIGQQKVDVYRGTTLVTTSAVSTGAAQHPTFIGAFSIMQKARWHHSNIYSNAPMPWMNRLTWSGDENFYERTAIYWRINGTDMTDSLDVEKWRGRWQNHEKPRHQSKPIWVARPEDHRHPLHEQVPKNYALRAEVGDLGFRLDDLPQPPGTDEVGAAPDAAPLVPPPVGDEEESP